MSFVETSLMMTRSICLLYDCEASGVALVPAAAKADCAEKAVAKSCADRRSSYDRISETNTGNAPIEDSFGANSFVNATGPRLDMTLDNAPKASVPSSRSTVRRS